MAQRGESLSGRPVARSQGRRCVIHTAGCRDVPWQRSPLYRRHPTGKTHFGESPDALKPHGSLCRGRTLRSPGWRLHVRHPFCLVQSLPRFSCTCGPCGGRAQTPSPARSPIPRVGGRRSDARSTRKVPRCGDYTSEEPIVQVGTRPSGAARRCGWRRDPSARTSGHSFACCEIPPVSSAQTVCSADDKSPTCGAGGPVRVPIACRHAEACRWGRATGNPCPHAAEDGPEGPSAQAHPTWRCCCLIVAVLCVQASRIRPWLAPTTPTFQANCGLDSVKHILAATVAVRPRLRQFRSPGPVELP
jgi:hypothetical protein